MICPKCSKDECVTETRGDIISYLCLGCGYHTKSDYKTKNFQFQPTLIQMDAQTKKMLWKDDKTGLYWFPINFDIPKVGVLYPQGTADSIQWTYMPMIEISSEDRRKYPGKNEIPDQHRKKTFDATNLKDALRLLKIIE